MAKQILIGIKEKNLSEVAHYLMIYFPYGKEFERSCALSYDIFPIQRGNVQLYGCMDG